MSKATTKIETKVSRVGIDFTEDILVLIEASKLSMDDEFMLYKPEGEEEEIFKARLSRVIKSGKLKDFYCPKYAPSFNEECTGICYKTGEKPAVGKPWRWWRELVEKYSCDSIEWDISIGSNYYYVAFLGTLIKKLIAKGWPVKKAWRAVCRDSKNLGNYWNSVDTKHELEPTGSREVCEFCDLANTSKMLLLDDKEKNSEFLLAGGNYNNYGNAYPLADLNYVECDNIHLKYSVGWLVFERKNGN